MDWSNCKNVLIIRPDNMGDLIMSSPAIRALKQSFDCKITLLTSSVAANVVPLIPEIDEVITATLPWTKTNETFNPDDFKSLVEKIRNYNFCASIIFTVFSQNPLPTAMIPWMAGIPIRMAYCHENPYDLLNFWIPDDEPFSIIRHQVERDLHLVSMTGASTLNNQILLYIPERSTTSMKDKLNRLGISSPFYIFHAGVSELKRAYPVDRWITLARETIKKHNIKILFTGTKEEKELTDHLQNKTGTGSYSLGGLLDVTELAALINESQLLVSVNSGPVHIAAGLGKFVIVLYSQSNPQHTPWKVDSKIFEFSVPSNLESKNEIIRYVNRKLYSSHLPPPEVNDILQVIDERMAKSVNC